MNSANMTTGEVEAVGGDVFMKLNTFGKFQCIQFILICLSLTVVSTININYIFVAQEVNHRCLVPKCEGVNPAVEMPSWWPNNVNARCFRPVIDDQKYFQNDTCSKHTFNKEVEDCLEWVFESDDSVVSALNLGCQEWKVSLIGTVHNAAMIISVMTTGLIADKIGRKPVLITCAIAGIVGLSKMFISDFYLYLGIEFLESLLASGLYTVVGVLLTELLGSGKRVLAGSSFCISLHVGEIILGVLAMEIKYWKYLIAVMYSPLVLFIFYCYLLKESTRWQLLRGRIVEAKKTFSSLAKMNKLTVTEKQIMDISSEELCLKLNVLEPKEKETLKDIVKSKIIMMRLVILSVGYFSASFMYYGIVVNSVFLNGNKYTNFLLTAVFAFPGDLISLFVFSKFGRKIPLQISYLLESVILIGHSYTPTSIFWLKLLLFLLGKVLVVVCMTGTYIYILESFPTSARGTLLGICNTASRVGILLAPLTPLLLEYLEALPSLTFTASAIISALLLSFIPDSKNQPMFDTIQQIETYKY